MNHRRDAGTVSKLHVSKTYGFNGKHIDTLVSRGIIARKGYGLDEGSIRNLREGEHYVACKECGRFQAMITPRHLRMCSSTTLSEYVARYPDAPLLARLCRMRKAKTPEQRKAQSEILKARFHTAAGDITRQQISAASKRLHESGYREKAVDFLRKLNDTPERRAAMSEHSKRRWVSGEQRAIIEAWNNEHHDEMLASAAHARRHIRKKFSKLHQQFKQALIDAGLSGFQTEYEVGFYSIDEALPELRLAVEVDGCYWHGCKKCSFEGVGDIKRYDASKTSYLANRGWTILRVVEHDIKSDMSDCIARVSAAVKQLEVPHARPRYEAIHP